MSVILPAEWDLPAGVCALTTTRGDVLAGNAYGAFNLATHVGDEPPRVEQHRQQLLKECQGLQAVQWLDQVHGATVHRVGDIAAAAPVADAAISAIGGLACAVLTADCLPVLFCDSRGGQVAAAHAGWRGLLGGVLANTLSAFDEPPTALRAWFGPCIRQPRFEVGAEVRAAFVSGLAGPSRHEIAAAFRPSARAGHYLCDLAGLAALQLRALGLEQLTDSGLCSYDDPRFYSYRRESPCGRFATLIYRKP